MDIKLLSVVKLTQDHETSDTKSFIDISGKAEKNMISKRLKTLDTLQRQSGDPPIFFRDMNNAT